MASPNSKRHLSSRLRQRGSPETSKTRELDSLFVFIVGGIVTLELAFSATLNAVPRLPYRARHHSLSRRKVAYYTTLVTGPKLEAQLKAILKINIYVLNILKYCMLSHEVALILR